MQHTLLIIFYTPTVFRLRCDLFSEHPYTDSKGSGDSYAIIDDRTVDGEQPYPYAIVKEKPTPVSMKVNRCDS